MYWVTDGPWGSHNWPGQLPAHNIDLNFWELFSAIASLQDHAAEAAVGISYIFSDANNLYVVLTDHTTEGPFLMPPPPLLFRGQWQALTLYNIGDIVTNDGSIYYVAFAHTSAATFDPGANDGHGHNFYVLWLAMPSDQLPAGGTTGQALVKHTNADYDTEWMTLLTLPPHGDAGDVLVKVTNADGDAAWIDQSHLTGGSLTTLSDVLLSSPANGDVLTFVFADGLWENRPLSVQKRGGHDYGAISSGLLNIDPTLGNLAICSFTTNASVEMTATPADGDEFFLLIIANGTTPRTIDFSTLGSNQGTLSTGSVNAKQFMLHFVYSSELTALVEVARTTAM